MTISHLSMRVMSLLHYGDWLEKDVFKLGSYCYRVTGYDNDTKAVRVEPVTNDFDSLPTLPQAD